MAGTSQEVLDVLREINRRVQTFTPIDRPLAEKIRAVVAKADQEEQQKAIGPLTDEEISQLAQLLAEVLD